MKQKLTIISAIIALGLTLKVGATPFKLKSKDYYIGVFSANASTAKATEANFKMVKDAGIDFVHSYSNGKNIERDLKFLDMAQKYGLKVAYNLYCPWTRQLKDKKIKQQMLRVINAVKDHPAMGMWYIYDEPDINLTANLRTLYGILKQVSPSIPVGLCVSWNEDWKKFADVCDVLMFDFYPVADQPFPKAEIGSFSNFNAQAVELGKPVMAIPQMFNWRYYPNVKYKNQPERLAKSRFPNEQELRFMLYSSLCMGSRGMMFYSLYCGMHGKNGDKQWMHKVMFKVIRELREFVTMAAPAHLPVRLRRVEDANYYAALWRNTSGVYLVLVNNYPMPRPSLSRWLEGQILDCKLTSLGSTRKVDATITEGRLIIREEIQPWETFVWKVELQSKKNHKTHP